MCLFTFMRILQGSWEMGTKEDNLFPLWKKTETKDLAMSPCLNSSDGNMRKHMLVKTDIHFLYCELIFRHWKFFSFIQQIFIQQQLSSRQVYILCIPLFLRGQQITLFCFCSLKFYTVSAQKSILWSWHSVNSKEKEISQATKKK